MTKRTDHKVQEIRLTLERAMLDLKSIGGTLNESSIAKRFLSITEDFLEEAIFYISDAISELSEEEKRPHKNETL